MKIQFGGKEFLIQFFHNNNHQFPKHVTVNGKRYSRPAEESSTVCKILEIGKYTLLGTPSADFKPHKLLLAKGKAICLPTDQFIKDKGRRIALQKALKDYDAAYEFRQYIWKKYNEEMKLPKK